MILRKNWIGFASFVVLMGCNAQLGEDLQSQIEQATGGVGAAPAPWTTFTASSGTTSYREKGTLANVPYGFLEYLPAGYASAPTGHYPLVIFLHGSGEKGAGTIADMDKLRYNSGNSAAVQYSIDRGRYYNAVVLTPQTASSWPTGDVDALITYAVSHYKVNPKRVLLTGLSLGGGGVWNYLGVNSHKIAAAIPICASSNCATSIKNVIANNVKIWSFHATDDDRQSYTSSVSCMDKIGAAFGQVGSIDDVLDKSIDAQTAHFSIAKKNWVFEPEVDCVNPAGLPWAPNVCQTFYKTGKHGIWGRVYQHATDLPMIWLLNQVRP